MATAKATAKKSTKLLRILTLRGMSQNELQERILEKTGKEIGIDRINRIVNGRNTNYTITTAKCIAEALEVALDDIVD